jgi:hypothetical protein
MVPVQEWRDAILGPRKRWVVADPKQMAMLAAMDYLRESGLRLSSEGKAQQDEAEAVCVGVFVARCSKE